jgi:hypothetical protein
MTQRKTRDEWQLWSNYGFGWEHELSEDTAKEMRQRLQEYRINCPQYQFKAVKKRVKIDEDDSRHNRIESLD